METDLIELSIVVVCVLLSAFFSSSEAAFLSVRRTARLAHQVQVGVPAAGRVAQMLEEPGRLLSTILLGNNLVNVAFTALITALMLRVVEDEGTGLVVATAVGTITLLLFGEVLPKTVAVRFPMSIAMLYTRPLRAVELALFPLVILLQWATRITNVAGSDTEAEAYITKEEVRTLIDIGEQEGEFEPEEAERLVRVLRFGDRQVREMMTPRTEIISVAQGTTLAAFLDVYRDHSHARFPVYKESPEDIVGVLSTKDILKGMSSKAIKRDEPVTDVLRDVYFVPETKLIAELFDEMARKGGQMGIVVDEFGGVAGLVTLKSLLEEVSGDIGEEGARPEEEYEALGAGTFQIDGGMSVDEAVEELGIELPEGDFETVAGFVLEVLGHIPKEGERFKYGGLKVEVAEMKGLKIEAIKLTKLRT